MRSAACNEHHDNNIMMMRTTRADRSGRQRSVTHRLARMSMRIHASGTARWETDAGKSHVAQQTPAGSRLGAPNVCGGGGRCQRIILQAACVWRRATATVSGATAPLSTTVVYTINQYCAILTSVQNSVQQTRKQILKTLVYKLARIMTAAYVLTLTSHCH